MGLISAFKLSDMGLIPATWNCHTVRDLMNTGILEKPMDGNHGSIHPKSSDFVEWGIPFVMANNVQNGAVDLDSCSFISKEQADSLQKGFSIPGDVLLTHKATIGNTAIVGELPWEYIMLTPQVTYYRVNDRSRLDNRYLRHFFDSDPFQRVMGIMAGGGTRSYIGISAQQALPIVLPPLNEQVAIAEALSDADALIESLEQLIAKKRLIKQGVMPELLTGKMRLPGFETTPHWQQTEVGTIPADWLLQSLSSVLDHVGNGLVYQPSSTTTYPITRIETIASGDIDFTRVGYAKNVPDIERYRLRPHDILYSHINSVEHIGKVALYDGAEVLYHGMNLLRLRVSGAADPRYLFYSLQSSAGRKKARTLAKRAVSQASINTSELRHMPIALPPSVAEQTAIASVLSDMDAELEALDVKLKKARQIKQGMMHNLLTGKIRLV